MRREKKFNIEAKLLDKLYAIKDIKNIDDFVNESLKYTFDILEILRKAKGFEAENIDYFISNSVILSDKTIYELKNVKNIFKNLKIAENTNDELINYSLRLTKSISNTKLPKK